MPESLGKTLRKIRESKHLTIEQVSERTRIPQKIIANIEEDKLQGVHSDFYAKGFVKSYVQFLGAMNDELIKEYLSGDKKKEVPNIVLKGEWVPGDWFQKNKKYIGIGILVIFSTSLFFFGFLQVKKLVKKVATAMSEAKHRKTQVQVPQPKKPATSAYKSPEKKQDVELEIQAHSDTWLEVVSDGKLLFRGVLKKGESDIWSGKKEIKLELGNAGGVTFSLNGKNLGSPGRKGEKKEIVVTKDGIENTD